MSQFDINCAASFAEAFSNLPDGPEKPQTWRLADGEHVDIAYVRNDGSAVTTDSRWLDTETMRKAEKLG